MRPSISVSLEPGLERGVPWGRDLYTFVTSAAGHMMRTLQKPRKNRPSKRQVNHRRFLHNMIQRKFADIEAANHRLASALYFKEGEKNMSSLSSHKPQTPDQSAHPSQRGSLQDPDKCSAHTDTDHVSKLRSDISADLYETEVSEKKQPGSGPLWKHPKSQSSTCTTRMNTRSKIRRKNESRSHKLIEFTSMSSPTGIDYYHRAELFPTEYYNNESQVKPIGNLSDDTQTPLNDSSLIQFAQNGDVDVFPSFSPELSPLSLDSCDFSIQMFRDLSACTQAQKSIPDIAEGPLTDIMDLFSDGSKDLGGCMDVEAYFKSICACQGDAGLAAGADDVLFADQSDSVTEVEDLHCEGGDCRYGYSCHGDQGLTADQLQSNRRSSQTPRQNANTSEEHFNSFKPDIAQNRLPTSISYHDDVAQLQTFQEESPCVLVNCENNLNFTPFEGVAQSFSAPLHNPEHRPIPTPPHEDDWLFTDILTDRKSPDYQENMAYFEVCYLLN